LNYYESVVVDYLRADRSLFVNTECCIQLNPGDNPDTSGSHWYCDALAVDFELQHVFLCESTYSAKPDTLLHRLSGWNANWNGVRDALVRDSCLPEGWEVRPWLFVPEMYVNVLLKGLDKIKGEGQLSFRPVISTMEMVEPWKYCSWNRKGESQKPDCIPLEMRY
jgi:hypothetical protein